MKYASDDALIDLSTLPGIESVAVELCDALKAGHASKALSVRQRARLLGVSDRTVHRLAADHDERLAAIVASDTAWRCGASMQFQASHLEDLADEIGDGLPDLAAACRQLARRLEGEREALAGCPWRRRAEALL